jgi:hypothetical protein
MKIVNKLKSRVSALGKDLAYSAPGHELARKVLAAPSDGKLRTAIAKRGLDDSIRRIASENLPQGTYFAKLRIDNWQKHNGKPFRLLQGDNLVYGNQIEPPARGFPLEYRNIMVTSDDPRDFKLDIDTPFTLKIGRGAFTTPQQLKYDKQYGVQQHGDVFYSLRGNTKNPTKLLLTFPGFGPSTSRISYAVSYLKALTDADLKDTLMVCFQDRYLAAGSYMMVDNASRPLYDRVHSVIKNFSSKFTISDENILFFGASKGGSIAIHYAQEFPGAKLLLGVPQMNLPYYFNKPFFKDNLFRNETLQSMEQPESILAKYFAEGRKIDYFYTNNDELSNHSLIEFASDVENLTKYRFDGVHGAVARAALPAMLGIMRRFIAPRPVQEIACEQLNEFPKAGTLQVQTRVDPRAAAFKGANWFIEGSLGRTVFRQIMTEHAYSFLKYTADNQKLFGAFDQVEQLSHVTAMNATGAVLRGALSHTPAALDNTSPIAELDQGPLLLDTNEPRTYSILDNTVLDQYQYVCQPANPGTNILEIRLTSDLDGAEAPLTTDSSISHVAIVEVTDNNPLIVLLALRFQVASRATSLRIVDDEGCLGGRDRARLRRATGMEMELAVVAAGQ